MFYLREIRKLHENKVVIHSFCSLQNKQVEEKLIIDGQVYKEYVGYENSDFLAECLYDIFINLFAKKYNCEKSKITFTQDSINFNTQHLALYIQGDFMQSENFDKSKTDINIKVTLLHYHYSEMSKQKNKLSVYDQINDVSVKGTGIKMIRVDTVIRKLTDCKFVYLDEGRKCDFSTFFTTYGDVVDVVVDSDCIGHTKYGDFNMKFDFDFTDLNTGLLCKIRDNKVVVIFDEFKYKYIYLSSSAYLENGVIKVTSWIIDKYLKKLKALT